ncbi:hypothetical protein AMJ57_00555 [Parcubacteria bacterium SG8_24]|nr:MAG: hypothetical protein AMJ57_00555 [Parcubacteria bacterium SG8_24]
MREGEPRDNMAEEQESTEDSGERREEEARQPESAEDRIERIERGLEAEEVRALTEIGSIREGAERQIRELLAEPAVSFFREMEEAGLGGYFGPARQEMTSRGIGESGVAADKAA